MQDDSLLIHEMASPEIVIESGESVLPKLARLGLFMKRHYKLEWVKLIRGHMSGTWVDQMNHKSIPPGTKPTDSERIQ